MSSTTDLGFNVFALDKASKTFLKLSANVDRLARKLDELDRKRANPKVDVDTKRAHSKLAALERRLDKMSRGRFVANVAMAAAPLAVPAAAGALAGGGAGLAIGGAAVAGVAGFAAVAAGQLKIIKDTLKKADELSTAGHEKAADIVMKSLSKQQLATAAAIDKLKSSWADFLASGGGTSVLKPLNAGMDALGKSLPALGRFLKPISASFGAMFDMLGDATASKGFKRFSGALGDFAAGVVPKVFGATMNLARAFGHLLRAFMPLGNDMGTGLVGLTDKFARWSATVGQSKGFRKFIDYARKTGPQLVAALAAIGAALIAVGKALAPLAAAMLHGLEVFAKWLARTSEAHPGLVRFAAGAWLAVAGVSALSKPLAAVVGTVRLVAGGFGFAWKAVKIFAFNVRMAFFVLKSSQAATLATAAATKVWTGAQWLLNGALGAFKKIPLAASVVRTKIAMIGSSVAARTWAGAQWLLNAAVGGFAKLRLAGAILRAKVATVAVAVATKVWAAGQWLLNAALTANPIGLVIVGLAALAAGIIYAYKHSKTFRKIVQGAWAAIKVAAAVAWAGLKVIFHALVDAFRTSVRNARSMWSGIKGAWDKIRDSTRAAMGWVSDKIRAVWSALKASTSAIWNGIKNAIKGAWDKIRDLTGDSLSWYSEKVRTTWSKIKDGTAAVWDAIKDRISSVWTRIKDILGGVRSFLVNNVVDAFRSARDKIGSVWDKLKSIAAKPVNFVIQTVYNKGIVPLVNKFLPGGSELKTASPIKLARGGIMPGYTPGRDVHQFYSPTGGRLDLSGGEPVMRPEFGRAVGHHTINRWNKIASTSGVSGVRRELSRQSFAGGGVIGNFGQRVWPVPGRDTSTYPGHDGVDINRGSGWDDYGDLIRAAAGGRISYVGSGHGYGNAIFESGPYGTVVYGHTSRQFVRRGDSVMAGQRIGRVGNSGNSSAPHLHFGFPGGTAPEALQFLRGALHLKGGSGRNWTNTLGDAIASPFSMVKDWIAGKGKKLLGSIPGGNTLFGKVATGVGKQLLSGIGGWVKDHIGFGGGAGFSGKAVGQAQRFAKGMLDNFGWGKDQFGPLKALWNGESGWRWNADNPSSSAYGIPQALPGSKMASAGADWRTNPATQIRWGLNYIKGRYGSPASAYSAWQGRSPHWYGNGLAGGIFSKPTLIGVGEKGPERVDVTPLKGGAKKEKLELTRKEARALAEAFDLTKGMNRKDVKGEFKDLLKGLRENLGKDAPLVKRIEKLSETTVMSMHTTAELRKSFNEAKQNAADARGNMRDLSSATRGNFTGSLFGGGEGLAAFGNARHMIFGARRFKRQLRRLHRMGLSDSLLSQIASSNDNESASDLLRLGRPRIRRLNRLQKIQMREAREVGEFAGKITFGDEARHARRREHRIERAIKHRDRRLEHREHRAEHLIGGGERDRRDNADKVGKAVAKHLDGARIILRDGHRDRDAVMAIRTGIG